MTRLRYPARVLWADAARACAGALAVAVPLALAATPAWLTAALVIVLALFAAHLATTALRAVSRFDLDDGGLRARPAGTRIDWDRLDALHLDYYSTRRDGRDGWMQLRLRAGRERLRVDSSLAGFDALLGRALRAARERGLTLSPSTTANVAGMQSAAGGLR